MNRSHSVDVVCTFSIRNYRQYFFNVYFQVINSFSYGCQCRNETIKTAASFTYLSSNLWWHLFLLSLIQTFGDVGEVRDHMKRLAIEFDRSRLLEQLNRSHHNLLALRELIAT